MVRYLVRETTRRERVEDWPFSGGRYGDLYREYRMKEKVLQYQDKDGNWVDVETVEEGEEKSNG